MVVDNLYLSEASEEVSSAFSFDSEVIERALRNIYSKEFNAMTDIEQNLFAEFWSKLNFATDKGVEQSKWRNHEADFIEALHYNNGVFSAFKTHRLQSDVAKLLFDSNGNRKPFKEWLNDVRPIANHQCYDWFKTEYITATNRAHLAADWKQFEEEKDILPNLEWLPTTSVDPRHQHMTFYGLILPIDHWFWKEHIPGQEWGCKCELAATAAERTPEEKIPIVRSKPTAGLDSNPADKGEVFTQSHPYIANGHKGAKDCVLNFMQNQITARMKKLRQIAKPLTEEEFEHPAFSNTLKISNKGIKEWLNQPHKQQFVKNELILEMRDLISSSKYVGFGVDKHDKDIIAHVLEIEIMGDKSWVIAREMKNSKINIHSVSDSENILKLITKKPKE
ncbi:MAG: hypothetical protein SNJ29_11195 [Rikenellaceae bacterium]